ncbi:hypothetical protein LCGC14_1330300 [marine sediment metagenome]|uniref:Phage tail tape measure protein domain-containing protein n=1 Tax=marine sediment metagenome TaxID=412755 RepID=A0A0F9KHH9_9ZZZZ
MSLIVKLIGKDRLSPVLDKSTSSAKGLEGRIGKLGLKFAKFGAAAVVALTGVSIKLSIDLEKGLREVGTLMGGLTRNEMKAMSKELRNIAVQSGQALDKLVKAKYDIVSAGFAKVADSAKVLEASAMLAVGGVTEVSKAADIVTTALNAYNLTALDSIDVSDLLFTVVRLGKTTMDELSGSLGRVFAIAGQVGISMEEVGAAVATLTSQGLDTARAVTSLQGAIIQIIKPTEIMKGVIKDLKFATGEALLKQVGFAEALKLIKKQSEKVNIPLSEVFGSIEALQAVLPLAGSAAKGFAENLNQISDRAGATADAVAEMEKSTAHQLARMKQAFVSIGIVIGDFFIPIIADAAEAIANLFTNTNTIRIKRVREEIEQLTKDLETQLALTEDASLWDKIWATGGTGDPDIVRAKIQALQEELELLKNRGVEAGEEIAKTIETLVIPSISTWGEAIEITQEQWERMVEFSLAGNEQLKESFGSVIEKWLAGNADMAKGFQVSVNAISKIGSQLTQKRLNDIRSTAKTEIQAVLDSTKSEEVKADEIANIREQAIIDESKARKAQKPFLIAQAIANTALAVVNALTIKPLIPVGLAAAVLVGAAGALQVATIAAQKFELGGRIPGEIPIIAHQGEGISSAAAMDQFGDQILRFNDLAESGGNTSAGSINININAVDGESVRRLFIENTDALAEAIIEAVRNRDLSEGALANA